MAPTQRSVLITGCSEGGMGWFVAKEFARQGWRTFATLRSPSKAGDLSTTPNVEILTLDVVSPDSIAACVEEVTTRTGGKLDCLYNNSGAQFVMPLADTSIEAARKLFETNVWGLLATTQAFLPLLIAAKGLIVNAASIRTFIHQPYDSIYGMSKAAVFHLSEGMRLEFRPLGVKVLTVHIGGVNTQIVKHQATNINFALPEGSYYTPITDSVKAIAKGTKQPPSGIMAPETFAKKIVVDIEHGKTGETWRGGFASQVKFAFEWLPKWILWSLANQGADFDVLEKHMQANGVTGMKVL